MRRFALVLLALSVTGCFNDPQEDALNFHRAIGESTAMVEEADLQFQVALLPVLRGEKVDAAAIASAQQQVKRSVEEAHKRVAQVATPDTNSARELAKAHAHFLERHDHAVAGEFAQAAEAATATTGDATAKVATVRDLFVRLQDAEYDDFEALRKAQASFATEHHLIVEASGDEPALSFLTALGVANGRLELGGKELGSALRPAMAELPVKTDRVESALKAARATLAAVNRLVDALKPQKGRAAKELLAAEKDYLKRQGSIFDEYFPRLSRLAADPVLVPETRKERLDEVLKLMQTAEEAPLMRLTAARDDFLREARLIRK